MPNPVIHWELASPDVERLKAYYAELFGWDIAAGSIRHYYNVRPGGPEGIGGGLMQTEPDAPPYLTLYVQVDDLAETLAEAVRLGGTQVLAPTPIPEMGRFALFTDPDGHLIGLFSRG